MIILPLMKNSNSSWGTPLTACSILMVMLKEKSNLCLSKRPKRTHQKTIVKHWVIPLAYLKWTTFRLYLCSHNYKHCTSECSLCCSVFGSGWDQAGICAVNSQIPPDKKRVKTDTCCLPVPSPSGQKTGWHHVSLQVGSDFWVYRYPQLSFEPTLASQTPDVQKTRGKTRTSYSKETLAPLVISAIHTSAALDLVSSSVLTSSVLSNMLPEDVANSRRRESERFFRSFLLSLVSLIRCSRCSSSSFFSKHMITLSSWSSRPSRVTLCQVEKHRQVKH